MKTRSDNFITGFLIGLVLPPVAFFIFCFFVYPDDSGLSILQGFYKRNVLTHVISLAALVNLLLFFGFLGSHRERSARGTIGATFLFAFIVVILKLT